MKYLIWHLLARDKSIIPAVVNEYGRLGGWVFGTSEARMQDQSRYFRVLDGEDLEMYEDFQRCIAEAEYCIAQAKAGIAALARAAWENSEPFTPEKQREFFPEWFASTQEDPNA